jgi:hypothetical protein
MPTSKIRARSPSFFVDPGPCSGSTNPSTVLSPVIRPRDAQRSSEGLITTGHTDTLFQLRPEGSYVEGSGRIVQISHTNPAMCRAAFTFSDPASKPAKTPPGYPILTLQSRENQRRQETAKLFPLVPAKQRLGAKAPTTRGHILLPPYSLPLEGRIRAFSQGRRNPCRTSRRS